MAEFPPPQGGQFGGPPPAGYPAGPAYGQPKAKNGLGITALILGLIALLAGLAGTARALTEPFATTARDLGPLGAGAIIGLLLGIVGLVLGLVAFATRRKRVANGGLALAGAMLGLVGFVAGVGQIVVLSGHESATTVFANCIEKIQNDQDAQKCQQEYEKNKK